MSFKESERKIYGREVQRQREKPGGNRKRDFPHLTEERKLVKIDLQFFTEKETDLPRQETGSLKRSIRKLRRRILEHEEKIAHPEEHCTDWSELSEARKKKRLEYWETEIKEFGKSIQRRIDELKKRGESTDE